MNFSEIGYRGDFIQLPPTYRLNQEAGLFLMATSYGNPNLAEQIFDECEREYLSSDQDLDVTSPFSKLTCLDGIANRIYTTMLFLNDYIYNNFNQEKYSEGLEFLILQKVNNKVYWSEIGLSNIFLKTHRTLLPISSSYGLRPSAHAFSPNLPEALLGVENSLNLKVSSTNIKSEEEFLFLKTKDIPVKFYSSTKHSDDDLIKEIYKTNPTKGAWLGRLNFTE